MTKDELDASAATRIRPDDLVTVVVGDADGFATELKSAGLGPVTIVPEPPPSDDTCEASRRKTSATIQVPIAK